MSIAQWGYVIIDNCKTGTNSYTVAVPLSIDPKQSVARAGEIIKGDTNWWQLGTLFGRDTDGTFKLYIRNQSTGNVTNITYSWILIVY